MASSTTRALTYAAAQTARVAFYGAHYLAARLIAREMFSRLDAPSHPMPSLAATLTAMRDLFVQDWKNIEGGLYSVPIDVAAEVRRASASVRFLADAPRVVARQQRGGHDEVKVPANGLPHYYKQNFHYQTDGYFSDRSASLYDFQVEALFAGTADAMRRRAYVPVARHLAVARTKRPVFLEIGCGTGGFLSFVKCLQPDLQTIALDLSEPYLTRAKDALRDKTGIAFVAALAESMPLPDASVDAATSIFTFHELPPKVREEVAREIKRVLKPGGIFVLADTIQYGDAPDFDGLIEVFPALLHEPYYASYAKTDLDELLSVGGLSRVSTDIAYLTKIVVFEKPKHSGRRSKNGINSHGSSGDVPALTTPVGGPADATGAECKA